jgi:KDO2-lipid IV(A) lauroyltransferase
VEVVSTPRIVQRDTWIRHIRMRRLEEALDLVLSDRPTILVTGHYGNWEVLGYLLAMLGIDLSAIARPIDNPLVNDYLLGVRQRKGLRIITKWGATEEAVEVLGRGGTLGFIGDQNAGSKGMFVPFFSRLASAYKSIGLLALRFNASVVCGYARRVGAGFEFEVGATDIIRPEDWADQPDPLYYLTARYTRAIEQMVREAPEQYLWLHRRWKSRPRHERRGKPMPESLRTKLRSLPWLDERQVRRLDQGRGRSGR